MIPAPFPQNETERQKSLDQMSILSTPREASFDRLVRLARKFFDVEIVAISLIDEGRQWFKSSCGLDVNESDRRTSFCGHAIASEEILIVDDASKDARFYDNPAVLSDAGIRFYAGRPLRNHAGYNVGTLCVASGTPRQFDMHHRRALDDFGYMAQLSLESRDLSDACQNLMNELDKAKRDALICPLSRVWNRAGIYEMLQRERQRAVRSSSNIAVAVVDIDHFKIINDTYGHSVGDRAIMLAGEILTNCARRYDSVGRVGGEEFMLILPGAKADDLAALGHRIVKCFRDQAHLPVGAGLLHPMTISVGLASFDGQAAEELTEDAFFEAADRALYQAKISGRDRYQIAAAG